jgi:hypothetical protein
MTSRFKKLPLESGTAALCRWVTAGAAAALTALALAPAQAAVVVGTFDPPFGTAIPNLGFRGTVTLDIPDACFALSPGLVMNSNPCSGGAMLVLSSTVEFYNVLEPGTPTFATQAFSFGPTDLLSIVTGSGPSVLGANTEDSAVQTLNLFDDGPDNIPGNADDVLYVGDFRLFFRAIDPQEQGPGPGPFHWAALSAQCTPSPNAEFCQNPDVQSSNRASIEFDLPQLAIPEPSGLALVMGALAAAGVTRRRRGA